VDAATGTIVRITIEADLKPEDLIHRASMMVEYGPVKIGDAVNVCPTRSVTISELFQQNNAHGTLQSTNITQINEVEFLNYRRFGSEVTILTADNSPDTHSDNPQAPTDAEAAAAVGPAASDAKSMPNSTEAANSSTTTAPPVNSVPNPAAAPSAAPSAPAAESEVQVSATDHMPDFSGDKTAPASGQDPGFTLQTTTRAVGVDLIAVDKHDKPIPDLQKDQIALFDNGRPQIVRDFFRVVPAAAPTQSAAASSDTFTNVSTTSGEERNAPDLLVVLLDESQLSQLDLARAKDAVLSYMAMARPTTRVAIYTIGDKGYSVLVDATDDHAQVIAAVKAWMPHGQSIVQAQGPSADARNNPMLNQAKEDIGDSGLQSATSGRSMIVFTGKGPLVNELTSLTGLARHFAADPGRKSIAWISGDAALAMWSGMGGGPQLAAAIGHTKEALSDAHIALYPINATAPNLAAGGFDATAVNPNGNVAAMSNGPPGPRLSVSSRADVQGGPGLGVPKTGDLKKALVGIDQESDSFYQLSFDPDTPADGKFHAIEVKAAGRKNVVLRYRAGYVYTQESTNNQQKLQQAVWSPEEAHAIALTATAVPATDSATGESLVRLRIAFPGLALQQKDSRWTDQLYIFVAVRDDAAQKAEVSGDTLRLSLKQASYESGMPAGIPYQRAVGVNSKLGSIRVIVIDGNSGKMGTVTIPASALQP
jgi:VWFA-related protein